MKPFVFSKRVFFLSVLIGVLTLIVAGYSLLSSFTGETGDINSFTSIRGEVVELYSKGIYSNDSYDAALQVIAQDLISVFIGLPLLIIGLALYKKGNFKGFLIITGTIGYILYTYLSYSFGLFYNNFFLLYVLLMSLSLFLIVMLLRSVDLDKIPACFRTKTPVKFFGILLILLSSLFLIVWMARIVPSFIGDYSGLHQQHYSTLSIQVIDLGIEIPLGFLAGTLILMRKPMGYLLTSVMLFKYFTLFLTIMNMVLVQHLGGVQQNLSESIIFIVLGLLLIISFIVLLLNIKGSKLSEEGRIN